MKKYLTAKEGNLGDSNYLSIVLHTHEDSLQPQKHQEFREFKHSNVRKDYSNYCLDCRDNSNLPIKLQTEEE